MYVYVLFVSIYLDMQHCVGTVLTGLPVVFRKYR